MIIPTLAGGDERAVVGKADMARVARTPALPGARSEAEVDRAACGACRVLFVHSLGVTPNSAYDREVVPSVWLRFGSRLTEVDDHDEVLWVVT